VAGIGKAVDDIAAYEAATPGDQNFSLLRCHCIHQKYNFLLWYRRKNHYYKVIDRKALTSCIRIEHQIPKRKQ
jgi:hypothetical protein